MVAEWGGFGHRGPNSQFGVQSENSDPWSITFGGLPTPGLSLLGVRILSWEPKGPKIKFYEAKVIDQGGPNPHFGGPNSQLGAKK